MAKTKPTTITKRFYLDEKNPELFLELPVRPGKHTIELSRTEADVLYAKQGRSLACMNSVCIKREASEGKMPHPVFGVVFDTCMAYIIDKVTPGRQWKSAVRYKHNDRNGVKIHDQLGPKEIIRRGKAVKTVVLSPPNAKPSRQGSNHTNTGSPREHMDGTRLVIPSGTRRRAMEAGILFPGEIAKL